MYDLLLKIYQRKTYGCAFYQSFKGSVPDPRVLFFVFEETPSVPLKWHRRQIPLAQALVLTISQVQGHTLKWVAVRLENPVVSHG